VQAGWKKYVGESLSAPRVLGDARRVLNVTLPNWLGLTQQDALKPSKEFYEIC